MGAKLMAPPDFSLLHWSSSGALGNGNDEADYWCEECECVCVGPSGLPPLFATHSHTSRVHPFKMLVSQVDFFFSLSESPPFSRLYLFEEHFDSGTSSVCASARSIESPPPSPPPPHLSNQTS